MIAASTLLGQINSSCPYVFESEPHNSTPFHLFLKKAIKKVSAQEIIDESWPLDDYFFLCLSAHWASAGSFCPTDVDNVIRYHLWNQKETSQYARQMWQLTVDALFWDYQDVTNKIVPHQSPHLRLSTHEGTWFSVAVGAYACALRLGEKFWEEKILDLILWELAREEEIAHIWLEKSPLTFIKLCPLIAHNLGDFDRVIELGNVPKGNILNVRFHKLGEKKNSIFQLASQYYKTYQACDGHRYFALRTPRCLRKSPQLLLPVAPMLESWGKHIAQTPLLTLEEKAEVVFEIADGYRKLPGETWAYPRAYSGFLDGIGNLKKLEDFWTSNKKKIIQAPDFTRKAQISDQAFQARYLKALEKTLIELPPHRRLFSPRTSFDEHP